MRINRGKMYGHGPHTFLKINLTNKNIFFSRHVYKNVHLVQKFSGLCEEMKMNKCRKMSSFIEKFLTIFSNKFLEKQFYSHRSAALLEHLPLFTYHNFEKWEIRSLKINCSFENFIYTPTLAIHPWTHLKGYKKSIK